MPAPAAELPAPPTPSEPPLVLTPRERLEALCDPGSVHLIRSLVRSARLDGTARDGDGVLGAHGTVDGRPVACFAQDARFAGGSLGEAHAGTILRVLDFAGEARIPVVGFVESAGARMHEGAPALDAYGRVFRANVRLSGRVPQISVITGTAAGGGVYSPALTDFILMTSAASMFLTGPQVVRSVTGEEVTAQQLGGAPVHERNGVCHLAVGSPLEAALVTRRLLSYLPQHAWESPRRTEPAPPLGRDPGSCLPPRIAQVYDVRDVVRGLVDEGELLEIAPRWARNVVIGFARLDGRSVGIVANQPRHRGGVLDVASAQKAARFVRTCNAFQVPLVVLVDTPGFMPGTRQEGDAVIRHGAKLLHAFAEATVPKLTVILRRAYGGGYITMNSKDLGSDLVLAWPTAAIGIMGAEAAVAIIHRRLIAAAPDPDAELGRLAEAYARGQDAETAARLGTIDEVVQPIETRGRLAAALTALAGKPGAGGSVSNIPL